MGEIISSNNELIITPRCIMILGYIGIAVLVLCLAGLPLIITWLVIKDERELKKEGWYK